MNDLASEPESHKQERRLRMGIIATEFPPMVGGMEQHAFGLANTLAETDEICVFTHVRNAEAVKLCNFPIKPVLEGTVYADVKSLRSESVDTLDNPLIWSKTTSLSSPRHAAATARLRYFILWTGRYHRSTPWPYPLHPNGYSSCCAG